MVRIGFVGCHEVSWHCLKKICSLASKFNDEICVVFDLDPKEYKKHSAVRDFITLSQDYKFPLYHVANVSDDNSLKLIKDSQVDVLFIIGWHRIVPQKVLELAPINLGIHTSLLPKDRGASPINWQIIRGEKNSGATLFHLTEGVDEGDIVDMEEFTIDENDNVKTVYDKAIIASINMLENNWKSIHDLKVNRIKQDETKATKNERRRPSDGLIDWSKSAKSCYDWIRALTFPYPGAFTFWKNKKIYIWDSEITNDDFNRKMGEIIINKHDIIVQTGKKSIKIKSLQVENEPVCTDKIFLKSYNIKDGEIFR